jgi:capsular polysaccharide biosynthesis protein
LAIWRKSPQPVARERVEPSVKVPYERPAPPPAPIAPEPKVEKARRRSTFVSVLLLSWIPIVLAAAGVAGALAYSHRQPVLYEARSQVVVSPGTKFLDPQVADSFPAIATSVQEIALTQVVLQDAQRRLQAQGVRVPSIDWLRNRLRLTISGDTPVLSISGVSGRERLASQISAAEMDSLAHAITVASTGSSAPTVLTDPAAPTVTKGAKGTTSALRSRGLTLTIFSKGENLGKIQPKPKRNALLGGNAGLIAGCFLVALLVTRPRGRLEP